MIVEILDPGYASCQSFTSSDGLRVSRTPIDTALFRRSFVVVDEGCGDRIGQREERT